MQGTAMAAEAKANVPIDTATPAPTNTPTPAPTRTPTATFIPLPTVTPRKPEIIKQYPEKPSTVVHTHHAGVWSGDELVPNAVRQMLDASITRLTGLSDAREAWRALFDPGERIAIKVNAFRNSVIWTHVPLVMAVTDSLQEAGIPAKNIVIFDYYTSELEEAGFAVNPDGPGVRCIGTDKDYSDGFEIVGSKIQLSNVLLSCDALINMPVLKSHMLAGMSYALKNHYGTLSRPQGFHAGSKLNMGLPELNALSPIKDRTRLIIGDALAACLRYGNSWPYWEADYTGDSIMMSFDPAAHDAVGFKLLTDLMAAEGHNTAAAINMATPWLENATQIGLGTHNFEDIDLSEINL
ncbi:MAG: DUF362 domain-containing protein [Anaerolineae bacterium]|nr:DUF362 domain-containing protein [Anaerolineae bacterium]